MLLLADKKMKGDIYLGLIKMMHRLLAIAHVITRSAINHFTARIQPGTLRMEHFIEVGLTTTGPFPTTQQSLYKIIDEALSLDDECGKMLVKNLSIPVYYATNKDVDVTQIIKTLRTKSRCISDNKIGSA